MNLKVRTYIARIPILYRFMRFLMYNSSVFYYKKIYKKYNYEKVFECLYKSKTGRRCFIIGNGPSLSIDDLEKLKNEDCFGVNEIHRIFPKTKWRPKYYVIMDRYSKSTPEEINNVESQYVFLGDYYCRYNEVKRKDAICIHQRLFLGKNSYPCSEHIGKYVTNSPTVSFAAMQIAAYLGYSEIYLLGIDHSYAFEFSKNGKIISTDVHKTHFFEDDNSRDIIGNVWGMTKAYESFENYARRNNIIVKNATRGGKLEIFERIDFDTLF